MKRAEFLKRLGIGAIAVVVAPRVIAEIKPDNSIVTDFPIPRKMPPIDESKIRWNTQGSNIDWATPSVDEIIAISRQTGDLIYDMRPYQESYQRSWFELQKAIEKTKP